MHLIWRVRKSANTSDFLSEGKGSTPLLATKIAVHILRKCKGVKDLVLGRRKTYTIKFYHWVSDVSNAPRKRIFVIVRFPEKLFERRSEAQICLLLPPNTSFLSTNYHIMIKCGENLIWGISSVGRASA